MIDISYHTEDFQQVAARVPALTALHREVVGLLREIRDASGVGDLPTETTPAVIRTEAGTLHLTQTPTMLSAFSQYPVFTGDNDQLHVSETLFATRMATDPRSTAEQQGSLLRELQGEPLSDDAYREAEALLERIRHCSDYEATGIIAEELRRARRSGQLHTYIYTPIVQAPWGEMQVTVILKSANAFDAERAAIAELAQWVPQYPWIAQAITKITNSGGAGYMLHAWWPWEQEKTIVDWYDERQP
jgi:hypothetical protein